MPVLVRSGGDGALDRLPRSFIDASLGVDGDSKPDNGLRFNINLIQPQNIFIILTSTILLLNSR